MKTIFWLLTFCASLCWSSVCAQNSFHAIIVDEATNEPLIGATAVLTGSTAGATADLEGALTITGIPDGKHIIVFSFVGYQPHSDTIDFPLTIPQPHRVRLSNGEDLDVVYVTATRGSRTIEDTPTRMEAITAEELGEKAVMNSANIAMTLRESTGIMVQQTSANSANQSLRIQGLDGRYTQLLKDGFPLYSGFSSGLSVMQVPPLDLRQVEVIKGSASTLYGGGAIAGLVNLVSKQPVADEPELSIMFNQTSALGSTSNVFWSQHYGKTGFTCYLSGNRQEPYDPNKDDFSDIPKVRGISVNPKLFWYPADSTMLWFGINSAFEDRLGGDMTAIAGRADSNHTFTERNQSARASTQFHAEHRLRKGGLVTARNSINYFNRSISIPDYQFQGKQIASFSEMAWSKAATKTDWTIGANLATDDFKDQRDTAFAGLLNYKYLTIGAFAQSNWNINKVLTLESGFRTDYNPDFGFFPLPRFSLMVKPSRKITTRLGAGMGYKLPTIFTEDAEVLAFSGIEPIRNATIAAEQSMGGNFDLNFKTIIGNKVAFSSNQLLFYTRLSKALVLEPGGERGVFSFANAGGPVVSRGIESNFKFTLGDVKLFLQYAFTDVQLKYNNVNKQKPLTPKHSAGFVIMYEEEHKWRIGYELYYIGQQYRSDYSRTRDYWMMGLMAMREWRHISVFVNFENLTDARQSRYQTMVTEPHSNPTFPEIWAPTDGFVANAGLMLKLLGSNDN